MFHDLKDIDLAIVKGNFAVAENGAIWMKMKTIDIELYILYSTKYCYCN